MLPLLLIGLRRGVRWGFLGCLSYGILDFMLDGGFSLNIASIFLDYLLSYAVLGAAGFFQGKKGGIWIAIPVCVLLRFCCLFLSGITIWADYTSAGWADIWIYSAGYNGAYLLVEMGLMYLFSMLLRPALPRLLSAPAPLRLPPPPSAYWTRRLRSSRTSPYTRYK